MSSRTPSGFQTNVLHGTAKGAQGKGPEAQGCHPVSLENWLHSSLLLFPPHPTSLRAGAKGYLSLRRPAEVGTRPPWLSWLSPYFLVSTCKGCPTLQKAGAMLASSFHSLNLIPNRQHLPLQRRIWNVDPGVGGWRAGGPLQKVFWGGLCPLIPVLLLHRGLLVSEQVQTPTC